MKFFVAALLFLIAIPSLGAAQPNVLFIAIDDLNDWVGVLGGHPQASTPNIDRLAKRGTLFTNAHCQAPICNPSRTSFMTGMRPSTTGIYENSPWFRTTARNRDRVTLSQYFGKHGYETMTTGKIYHGSRKDPASFETLGPLPGQKSPLDKKLADLPVQMALWDYGAQLYPEEQFNDYITASWTAEQLGKPREKPFFLAVGFYRPHVPFYAPKRFIEAREVDSIQLPSAPIEDLDDLPSYGTELTNNAHTPQQEWFESSGQWAVAVQAYLGAVSFTDAQVGRVLDALDASPHADNTIVVLFSDHGFHLGEKQRWAKQSLWERSTHVPLIISVPGGAADQRCDQPVELLSLYPTLIELCDLPERDDLDGRSVGPLLDNPTAYWPYPAITTYKQNNHAVRSQDFRYIRYADGSEELYDHRVDPDEHHNLANSAEHKQTMDTLAHALPTTNVPGAKGGTAGKNSGKGSRKKQ